MAFTSVTEKYPTPRHEKDSDRRSGRRVFTVHSDTDNQNLVDAEEAQGVPSHGQSYPGDFNLQVTRKSTRQITKRAFEVTVLYSARQDGENPEETDPLAQPAQISYSAVYYQEPADVDVDGAQIGTVNGEPFDPPIMIDQADMLVSITRNLAEFLPTTLSKYMNTINSDWFLNFTPHQLRIVGIRADKVTTAQPFYYRVTVDIQAKNTFDEIGNPIGWDKRILHQGFRVWNLEFNDDGSPKTVHATDDGTPPKRVTEPVLLRDNGLELVPGMPNDFRTFQVYREEVFATMNFGV